MCQSALRCWISRNLSKVIWWFVLIKLSHYVQTDHTDEIKETKYEGDEESSSCKSSSSETSYSEDKSSTTSSEGTLYFHPDFILTRK